MQLLEFINTTYDWEEILSKPPYCIEIKKDSDYVLLKYNQLESDFNESLVQECRGCIIKKNELQLDWLGPLQYHFVCRPFDKFFNYGEQQAATIDWDSAITTTKVDGCFSGEDSVLLSNGKTVKFKSLRGMLKRGEVFVLSYNFDNGKIENKKIVSLKRTRCENPSEWLTIKLGKCYSGIYTPHSKISQHNLMTVTKNHQIYIKRNDDIIEVSAEDLCCGDIVLSCCDGWSYNEEQVIRGTLLGDGSLTNLNTATSHKGVRFLHSVKQKEYVKYKVNLIRHFGNKISEFNSETSYSSGKVRYISRTHPLMNKLHKELYCNGSKRVTKQYLSKLDWLGFAIWYMDDGSRQTGCKSNSIHLHTEGYSKEEVEIIHNFYNDIGFKNYIQNPKKEYYIINFSTEASDRIWTEIRKYIPPCMEYKLPERHRGYFVDITDLNTEYETSLYESVVTDIQDGFNCHKHFGYEDLWKFDLEVEDNHNYFCNGILVHNSLIKCWFDNEWLISTNGTINAFAAPVSNLDLSFGDIFHRAIGLDRIQFQDWCDNLLDKDFTYMFELTSPETKVVINYEDGVYILAARNTKTGEYIDTYTLFDKFKNIENIKIPHIMPFHTLSDCIDIAEKMSMNEEGMVVVDKYSNRIKIKSPAYLYRAKLYGGGVKNDEYLLEVVLRNQQDDLLAYCPEYTDRVNTLLGNLYDFRVTAKKNWEENKVFLEKSRKDFALAIKDLPEKAYLFLLADGRDIEPIEYIKRLPTISALRLLENYA